MHHNAGQGALPSGEVDVQFVQSPECIVRVVAQVVLARRQLEFIDVVDERLEPPIEFTACQRRTQTVMGA